jgi:hypothetical protein
MLSSIASSSLIGLACLSVVSAVPFTFGNNPVGNGFPTITNPSDQLTAIEVAAHGSLPNGPPPPTRPSNNSLTSLQFIAFNELFEVAFFTELIANITNHVDGYRIHNDDDRNFLLNDLLAVQAQEELHLLNANGALKHFNVTPIEPCQYNFPVANLDDAIGLASTFTDVVLGTLQDVTTLFGTDGDAGLIRGVASVIGQEGEQNGFYRLFSGKTPSALPFLTTSTREFAFSALQGFTVPGSCPNSNTIDLPQTFQPLTVVTKVEPCVQDVTYTFTLPSGASSNTYGSNYASLSLTYINQQNVPLNVPFKTVNAQGNDVTFTATFPFNGTTFGNGLTIAAVTNSTGPFGSAGAVANATIAGPGLIEIN